MKQALIGSIERYCLHDGPGIRTTVFFKGCNLHCPWCHNPEFIRSEPEIAFYPARCILCKDCASACPEKAIDFQSPGRILRQICTGCGLCASACPSRALEMAGRRINTEELVEIVLRDRHFYQASGGGVTLSGGEPTLWMHFIGDFLKMLKKEGIHTAIETNGHFPWDEFHPRVLDNVDLFLIDLKIADTEDHACITGLSNRTIVDNIRKLLKIRPLDTIVRVPLVPGYTATRENILALSKILAELGARCIDLLPYHPFGISKADKVGQKVDASLPGTSMTRAELEKWQTFFRYVSGQETPDHHMNLLQGAYSKCY